MTARMLGGRYRLESPLGHGGMAAVWRGMDVRLGRPVAVKMLDHVGRADPVARQGFEREARTVAGLAHPNVVAVHDFDVDGGVPYLVMELVDGESLAARLVQGPLDVGEAVRIAGQVCAALAAAHAAGVVHRDIKPANILITRDGMVKVCDFGIARLQNVAAAPASLTPPTVAGTAEYIAPEQAAGGLVDGRTDLYALGCVLYAMLAGGPPFSGGSPVSVAAQHLHRVAVPVTSHRPDTPAELAALIDALLAKNPTDRPGDAGEVGARLTRLANQLAAPPVTRATAPVTSRPVRGSAAVASPTQALPTIDAIDTDAVAVPRPGLRLGPAGIAVVALGAAVLAAVLVAALLLTDGQSPSRTSPPVATTTPAAAVTTAPVGDPAALVTAVRAAIQQQVQAGQLDAKQANDLTSKLDEIDRHLAKGQTDKAADKVADLSSKLGELRKAGKISPAGEAAILPSLHQLANSLPRSD